MRFRTRHIKSIAVIGLLMGLASPLASISAQATPVVFAAADGGKVFADFEKAKASRALVVLFHQASSSRHEYDTIAPKLRDLGYDTLAVDQRSGGALFGPNETVAAAKASAEFLAAYKDMEAALKWAEAQAGNRPVIIWGSSYSASLVFLLAAQHPASVKALLSFSPGEYFNSRSLVREAAAKVKAPVFVSSDSSAGEASEARAIIAAVPGAAKTQYVPRNGSHGSSSLIEGRNPRGASENWKAVEAFLAGVN